jgi:nucleoside diphosphate kinase
MTTEQTYAYPHFIAFPHRLTSPTASLPSSLMASRYATPDYNSSSREKYTNTHPQRGLIGPIISRFENRGFKLAAIKLVTPSKEHLEKHYADLSEKPFFPGLIAYMGSGPVCAMVWEGRDAVKTGRVILGATNPLASSPGTIRGDFAIVRPIPLFHTHHHTSKILTWI